MHHAKLRSDHAFATCTSARCPDTTSQTHLTLSLRLHEVSTALGFQSPSLYFSCYLQGTTETGHDYKLRASCWRGTLGGTAESTPPGWIDRNETDCPGKMARLLYAPLTRRTEAIGPPQRRRQATGGRSDSLARRGQSRLSQHRQILSIARKGDAFQGAYG